MNGYFSQHSCHLDEQYQFFCFPLVLWPMKKIDLSVFSLELLPRSVMLNLNKELWQTYCCGFTKLHFIFPLLAHTKKTALTSLRTVRGHVTRSQPRGCGHSTLRSLTTRIVSISLCSYPHVQYSRILSPSYTPEDICLNPHQPGT